MVWFRSLPVSQRTSVAAIVGVHVPGSGLSIGSDSDRLVEEFLAWIEGQSSRNDVRHAALVVSLVAVTELFVISKRDNLRGWTETKAMLSQLALEIGNEEFSQMAEQKQFEGRQWIVSCENWKGLRSGALSNEAIQQWVDQQLPRY